jgi:hypothetical protein
MLAKVRYILLSASIDYIIVGPYARTKLRFIKNVQHKNTIKMKREVRRINWYTAKKEKSNDTKIIKD